MSRHLTVRMAWHDNNWNGKVCCLPEENVYCVGNHSLLSERLARDRKLEFEKPETPIGKIPGYLPPCYWTTNAFSMIDHDIEYKHPFRGIPANSMRDTLFASSVYTWPFRLSFNHSRKKKKLEGEYPPDLPDKISRFIKKFAPTESFVFFYLNYDNPISSEENKYVLVGCALISEVATPKKYKIDPEWLKDIKGVHAKDYPRYKNFPEIDWTLPVIYDFQETGIMLPYQIYWEQAKEHEERSEALKKMRVLIDEEELIPSFKYVANDIDDDKCIYLLYKLRKAIKIIQEDHLVDLSREEKKIDEFLVKAWSNRGLYPSLGKVLDVVAEFEGISLGKGSEIVGAIRQNLKAEEDLLEVTFNLLASKQPIPENLKPFSRWITSIRINLLEYKEETEALKKLSVFSLTHHQIKRILCQGKKAFKKQISLKSIGENPYLLAEEYVPDTSFDDLDHEEIPDAPIGLFSIDIGMHPDPNYSERNPSLHTLSPSGKERTRAIIIEYLYQKGKNGDCFSRLEDLYEYIRDYPLFYKSELNISEEKLRDAHGEFKEHLDERIIVEKNDTGVYYYLNEVKEAEGIIAKTIETLLSENDYNIEIPKLQEFNREQANQIQKGFPDFDKETFINERNVLFSQVLKKHFYVISGKPGSGKTKALGKIVKEMLDKGENVIMLTPTGKATLRLKQEVKDLNVEPQTIDRFVYSTDFRKCLESFENLVLLNGEEKRLNIQNLIVDECSMVDLQRLATLFEMLWKNRGSDERILIDRIILVGDENQLPPIGFGKPFYDIIDHLKRNSRDCKENYIQLHSNCRQGFDPTILKIAELYEGKNRYFEETIDRLEKGGEISKGLRIELWNNFDELRDLITERLDAILPNSSGNPLNNIQRNEGLNLLFGLYDKGYVKEFKSCTMKLESFQMLSPYRGELYGTLGLNLQIKSTYRPVPKSNRSYLRQFDHSDKIIRTNNWYGFDPEIGARTLKLSNGSIGLVCDGKKGRRYYFSDREWPMKSIDDDDNFELSYAITVHKAQGSEFEDVFFVLPKKQGLLMKELIYTGLTRSKRALVLFLQRAKGKGPLQLARERSAILTRNTSIFERPEDIKSKLWPDKNVPVKSKIEYILYKYLSEAQKEKRLEFKYERSLLFKNKGLTIHPDFTIQIGGKQYFWEHLGELDLKRYALNWAERRKDYETNGLADCLVTTDDLEGVKEEKILPVIDDLVRGKLKETTENKFSKHHYQLY